MPRQERNRMSLNTVGFQPTVFNGIEYKPVEQNFDILNKAMLLQEERKNKATQQHTLVKEALSKAREQLHQDDETLAWFDEKANKIENDINNASLVGDYHGALITGMNAAGDIVNDPELQSRIKDNAQYKEEYEKQRQRIGKGISQSTFDWWVKNNPYTHKNIEVDGKVIGGEDWVSNFTPVDDVNPAQLALTAFKLLSPKKNTTNKTSNINEKNEYSDITKVDNSSYEKINANDILRNIKSIIGTDPDNWRAVRQGFEVALNEISSLEEKYNSLDETDPERAKLARQIEDQKSYFVGENGQRLTNDENGWSIYYSRIVTDNMFANGLAYHWQTTDTRRIKDDPNAGKTSGTDGEGQSNKGATPSKEQSPGNGVKKSKNTSTASEQTDDAASRVKKRFVEHGTD